MINNINLSPYNRLSVSKASISKILLIATLLFSFFYLSIDTAHAQITGSASDITIESLESSAKSSDKDMSRSILASLLGDFADAPFTTVGSPEGIIGKAFFAFNVALFVVGVGFMSYTVVMSIVVSAHEGEIMGRRMSSLWVPIRYGMGVVGMIPGFKGFSLAQAVMMFIAILGIGLANIITTSAANSAADFEAIINMPAGRSAVSSSTVNSALGKEMFATNVCALSVGTYKGWFGTTETLPKVDKKGLTVAALGNQCGGVKIIDDTGMFSGVIRDDGDLFSWNTVTQPWSKFKGATGFRNKAVDYNVIGAAAKASAQHKQVILTSLQATIQEEARKWYEAYQLDGSTEYPLEAINKAVNTAADAEEAHLETVFNGVDPSSIKKNVLAGILDQGWMGVGSWYSTFAEANAALQSAAMASRFEIVEPELDGLLIDDGTKATLTTLFTNQQTAEDMGSCLLLFDRNATGNCAPAQNIFKNAIGALIQDTGGEGMVNPIIAAKNIGDWFLVYVSDIAGTAIFADLFESSGIISKITFGKFGQDYTQTKGKSEDIKNQGAMGAKLASLILTMAFILGITFGIYIPFVPFLTWFSGLVSYFASVLEGMVAAQVWAFSHLHTDGEGMGQRADKGYMFMLNMLLRPALMVMGFFFASALLVLLGTFFYEQFGTALANVQGNTTTGPFVAIGLVIVLGLGLLTLIQTVFNLIYEIPDRVIAWFGGGMEARMAKEMDGGIERGAKMAANWSGSSALGSMIGGRGR